MKQYNEYELLYMIRQKDEIAFELLIEKFKPLFYKIYKQFKSTLSFLDKDECYSAYLLALNNAVCYYREDKNMKFSNFVYLCTLREIKAQYFHSIHSYYYLHQPMLSLDEKVSDDNEQYLSEVIGSSKLDPWPQLKMDCVSNEIEKILGEHSMDLEILKLRVQGYSYKEISELTHRNTKYIDNSLQRIKKKIGSLFD